MYLVIQQSHSKTDQTVLSFATVKWLNLVKYAGSNIVYRHTGVNILTYAEICVTKVREFFITAFTVWEWDTHYLWLFDNG